MEKKYILVDKGQQKNKHNLKHRNMEQLGYELAIYPLPVGDYVMLNEKIKDMVHRKFKRGIPVKKMDFVGTYNTSVDTKRDLQELIGNVCGKQHSRFRDELILAMNNNIKLYVLVENTDNITCLNDLFGWFNPRLNMKYGGVPKYPNATKGSTLAKALHTMQEKYGCEFLFCSPTATGSEIIRLLGEKNE